LQLDTSYLSYKDRYEEAMRRSIVVFENVKKLIKETNGGEREFL
jgi:hypothetical protein